MLIRKFVPNLVSLLLVAPAVLAQQQPPGTGAAPAEPQPVAPAAPPAPAAPVAPAAGTTTVDAAANPPPPTAPAPVDPGNTQASDATSAAPATSVAPGTPSSLQGPELQPTESPAQGPEQQTADVEFPTKFKVGKYGSFQPGLLLQSWFWLRDQDDMTSTFRVRRAEVHIKGEIVPKLVSYKLMFDVAKLLRPSNTDYEVQDAEGNATGSVSVPTLQGDPSILQDVYITFVSDYADVSLGQFKVPLSWEGYNSASKLLFPERALASRTFGDFRDLGVRIEKKWDHFGYIGGLYNGEGQGRLDSNDQKDVTLRVEAYPIKGVTLAAVGYMGVGQRDEVTTKDRVEGDVRVELANALLQAEYLHGWTGPTGGDDRAEGHGYYIAAGYTFLDRVQPVARFGYVDTDVDSDLREQTTYEIGLNYFLQEQEARLSASYGIFDQDLAPGKEDLFHEFILAAQASF